MEFDRNRNASENTERAGAESNVCTGNNRHEQAFICVAGSRTQERGLLNQQHNGEQRSGRASGIPQGGRVSDAGREDLQKIQAELEHQSAIRDLGKNALMFALSDRERYVEWHIDRMGRRPVGF